MQNFNYKEYEITEKRELMPSTYLFRFKGKIKFEPGQFFQVALDHFGEGTFAPCSDPKDKNSFELCIRGVGSTTNQMIQLLPGDKLKIRGPYGVGWPLHELNWHDVVIIAGGLGLVPLRPLIYELIRNRINYNKISIFAGFKSADHILFESDLLSWRKAKIEINAVAELATDKFWCKIGLITEPLSIAKINPKKTKVLICGPDIMVPYCNKVLFDKKIKPNQIYISYERRMECGIGICQHCSCGKFLVCKDGPVFRFDQIEKEILK
ncbi:MAG: FAD/NAD(P)-binding protein [bacterium]